jgi:ribosomal protein L19E
MIKVEEENEKGTSGEQPSEEDMYRNRSERLHEALEKFRKQKDILNMKFEKVYESLSSNETFDSRKDNSKAREINQIDED